MLKFVIDEDLPYSTGDLLQKQGHEIIDIKDSELRGSDDREVYNFAQKEEAILLTGDKGFGNILWFPSNLHFGIVIAHFPNEMSSEEMNKQISKEFKSLSKKDFMGNLIILEPGRIRIHRHKDKSITPP